MQLALLELEDLERALINKRRLNKFMQDSVSHLGQLSSGAKMGLDDLRNAFSLKVRLEDVEAKTACLVSGDDRHRGGVLDRIQSETNIRMEYSLFQYWNSFMVFNACCSVHLSWRCPVLCFFQLLFRSRIGTHFEFVSILYPS